MHNQQDVTCSHGGVLVTQDGTPGSLCGPEFGGAASGTALSPASPPSEAPTVSFSPPTGQANPGAWPHVSVTVTNTAAPTQPHLPRPARRLPSVPHLWIVGVVACLVALILGSLLLALGFVSQRHTPAALVAATHTPPPSPTATPIPQVRMVVQLVDVACQTKEHLFGADSFYVKSRLTAPSSRGQNTTSAQTSNHYTINDGDTNDFNAADQVIFNAAVPVGGKLTGSLTAYNGDDAHELGTTNVNVSTRDSGQLVSWTINGRNAGGILGLIDNTWHYTIHYQTIIAPVAAGTTVTAARLLGGSGPQEGVRPSAAMRSAARSAEQRGEGLMCACFPERGRQRP